MSGGGKCFFNYSRLTESWNTPPLSFTFFSWPKTNKKINWNDEQLSTLASSCGITVHVLKSIFHTAYVDSCWVQNICTIVSAIKY